MEQLEDTKQKLAAVHGKMHSDLMGTRKELSEAQEEIAVKVAQVKQYQKQVEAYKQQLEQVLCKHLIIDINACTCAIVYCTFGGGGGDLFTMHKPSD